MIKEATMPTSALTRTYMGDIWYTHTGMGFKYEHYYQEIILNMFSIVKI